MQDLTAARVSDDIPSGTDASAVAAQGPLPTPFSPLYLTQVLALAAAQRRRQSIREAGSFQDWPVRIEDVRGDALCESVLCSLEALQNLREDLAFLGYVVVGRGPCGEQVFRHTHALGEP